MKPRWPPFLDRRIRFDHIHQVKSMQPWRPLAFRIHDIEGLLALDAESRQAELPNV
jgi:hypothetical protein